MALGTFTVVEKVAAQGPVQFVRATVVGDGAYSAGGSTGILAALKSALGKSNLNIISCQGEGDNAGRVLVYDHANEKLKVYQGDNDGGADGPLVEDATANQSGRTYGLFIVAY